MILRQADLNGRSETMDGKPKVGLDRSKTGRAKGTPNKTTALLKDAILKAATDAGDGDLAAYLQKQAVLNPGPFMALLGKVLPMQVANAEGETFRIQMIERRIVDPRNRDA